MKLFKSKKAVAIGAAAALTLGIAGGAFAYWTTNGSGTGSGTVASSNGSVTLTATFANGITPGGSEAVAITAANPGTSNLYVTAVTADSPAITVDAGHSACDLADFSLTGTVNTPAVVAAGASGVAVATDTLNMANTAVDQDACKGATITLHYTSV